MTVIGEYPVSARRMAVNPPLPDDAVLNYVYVRTVERRVPAKMSSADFWSEARQVSGITVEHRKEADPLGNYLQAFQTRNLQMGVLGHSLVRSLVHSQRSLVGQ